jgi:hypothetical protein
MADDPKPQLDKFADLARQLGADEDPANFEETVRKIVPKALVAPTSSGELGA